MKTLSIFLLLFTAIPSFAQQARETVAEWVITSFSDETVADLASDTENWGEGIKSGKLIRYLTKKTTDGELLKANGKIIKELDGVYIGKGISAGSLLLCHNNGGNNGVQMQGTAFVTLKNRKKGETVIVSLRSSSSAANGISDVQNLKGSVGSEFYTPATFKDFTFDVQDDGDIAFKNSGGIIFNKITVLKAMEHGPVATPIIKNEGKKVTISCQQKDAKIYYTTIGTGEFWLSYPQEYTGEIELQHTATVRAVARAEGYLDSDVASLKVTLPMNMPFKGKPFVLDPEPLSRGAIATYTGTAGNYLVNWRSLIDDPAGMAFNVYRNGVKLNSQPIRSTTCYLDKQGGSNPDYEVEIIDGEKTKATLLGKGYLDIPISRPKSVTTESGTCYYFPGDCMVADVDGDKEYEVIMKWDPCNNDTTTPNTSPNDGAGAGQKDNSLSGFTGPVYIDCYKIPTASSGQGDANPLWRIDLGKNIRAGAHYTQLMVYDLDGDGKAEVACKTAPGTKDGKGNYVLLDNDDPNADYRKTDGSKPGSVISGPEYLTVFSGLTGEEIATTKYLPARDIINSWGDNYGNRSERYLACVAYLDGQKPSLVMCRGYYTAAFVWAVDFDGKNLTTKWLHSDTEGGKGLYGEGAHTVQVADVDGDLCDEIVYGSACLDNDGTLLYRTGLGHGDALHVGDFLPDRDGLEVFMVHEEPSAEYGEEVRDALTGEHIAGKFAGSDIGRGMCADIDPSNRGAEYWGSDYVYACEDGHQISSKKPSQNFRTYWDGDQYDELTERGAITKYAGANNSLKTLVDMCSKYGAGTDLIKYTPCLQADIFGDWREEQIYYDIATKSHLMIFSTPYSTEYKVPTLMHDHHYRMATIWQTSAYNQPPHISFYLPDYIAEVTTGIKSANLPAATSTNAYNMNGQKVDKNYRGIMIKNGKKVLQR